jgi:hypothetical protein
MADSGLFSNIGKRISSLAPNFARLILALPASFALGTRALLRRLANPITIAAIIATVIAIALFWAPIYGAYILYYSPPTNKEVSDAAIEFWTQFRTVFADRNGAEIAWLSVGGIVAIAVLPWLLSLYLRIAFKLLVFSILWLLYVFTGFDPTGIKDTLVPPKPQTIPHETESTTEAQSKTASAELDTAPPTLATEIVESSAAKTPDQRTEGPIPADRKEGPKPTTAYEHLLSRNSEIKGRFSGLLSELQSREQTNLGIGMIFSIVGVCILAVLVFYGTNHWGDDKTEFLFWFIPRLSIALFIQIFAYFFLGLYRGNLMDIKYFNNEMTNMEYKWMATEIAMSENQNSNPLLQEVCLSFLQVERNFVLKKGETAIDVGEQKTESGAQIDRIDVKQVVSIIKNLSETLDKKA